MLRVTGEIERCLKKVAEGVETFEEIWKKVSDINISILQPFSFMNSFDVLFCMNRVWATRSRFIFTAISI